MSANSYSDLPTLGGGPPLPGPLYHSTSEHARSGHGDPKYHSTTPPHSNKVWAVMIATLFPGNPRMCRNHQKHNVV